VSVYEAVSEGRLKTLEATRDALAQAIDAGGGTTAQNVAQLRAVLAEIEDLSPSAPRKVTGLSDFEKRLRERESRAKGAGRAKSG
jgi:hypothetical protein